MSGLISKSGLQGDKAIAAAAKRHYQAAARGLRVGLLRAGLLLQRESQNVVPIDTGVLRGSAATRLDDTEDGPMVTVSYSTEYAVYVHEDLQARHKPGKIAKYLEKPMRDNRRKLINIVNKAVADAT